MPIRSDRGRNATLRILATWPLYSPRRLISTIAVLVVLCVAATFIATTHRRPDSTAGPAPTSLMWSASSSTSRQSVQTTVLAVGDSTAAARSIAEAWIAKTETQSWRTRLAPLCTDEFRAVVLAATEPSHVSATAVTGPATVIRASSRAADVTVPLDTMVLGLTLHDVSGSGDWRVADVQRGR